jgi:cytochrome c6
MFNSFFISLFFLLISFSSPLVIHAKNLEIGEKIFNKNCSVCHLNGNNIIIPEKNLKKQSLEANGMNSVNSIKYQVINGKNGMPAFGERLKENEIEEVAYYILIQSEKEFKN